MSTELNQQGVTQVTEQNQPLGEVNGGNTEVLSNEELASKRSQARNEFFAGQDEDAIFAAIENAENGIPLDLGEEKEETREESRHNVDANQHTEVNESQEKGGQDNGLQIKGQKEEIVEGEQPNTSLLGGENKQEETPPKVDTYKIKVSNKEFDFTLDELKQMASKGMDYTNKMQRIAPFRKMINAIETNNISEEDINQLIEMKKGNKDAVGAFTKKYNIALSDIEAGEANAANYKPQSYGREPTPLDDIDMELRASMVPTQYDRMVDFINTKLDQPSQQFFIDNPEALRLIANDIESGMFDKVMLQVEKGEYLGTWNRSVPKIERYRETYLKMNNNTNDNIPTNINNSTTNAGNNLVTPQETMDKSKLGLTGTNGVAAKQDSSIIQDLNDLTDEEFEKFWKQKTGADYTAY